MIALWNTAQFLFSPMTGMSNYCINHHSSPLTRAAQMLKNLAQEIFMKRNMWTTFFPNHHFLVVDSISSFWKHMKAPKFGMPRSFQTNFKPSRFRGMVYRPQIQHGTWKWWGIWFFFPPPPKKKKQIRKKKKNKLEIIHFHTFSLQPFR